MKRILYVGAVVALAAVGALAPAAEAQTPKVTMCTGGETGKYHEAGGYLRKQLGQSVNLELKTSEGSKMNLARLESGECNIAIVQSDAYGDYVKSKPGLNIRRITTLYPEYVHMICSAKSGIDRVTDIKAGKNRVYIGDPDGGTAITWRGLVRADEKKYGNIVTEPEGGVDALLGLRNDPDNCLMFVAGLKSGTMMKIDEHSAGAFKLVRFDDRDLKDIKDPKGNQVYTYREIPKGTYKNLQAGSWYGTNTVDTVTVDAVLVASEEWYTKNRPVYSKVAGAVLNALPEIHQSVGFKQ